MQRETISNAGSAQIVVQALPYIKQFRDKTIVVKYGGNAMINNELKAAVIDDILLMFNAGIRIVLVHGGGPEIDAMLKKTGKESRFVKGLRYTDNETMEIVQMVLCGKVNKDITGLIGQAGGRAVGLCGIDGTMLKAVFENSADLGFVGNITEVDISVLNTVLNMPAIPVVSSVAFGIGDAEGYAMNVNADTAAAKIAAALGAEKLVLMTDVPGILRNVNDPGSLVRTATLPELEEMKKQGILSKGMIPKADCCIMALSGGVKKAHIIDGRVTHALLMELFTGEGIGTMIQ